ncbi:hypothetical protein VOLCADRAFT_88756 [Volvox carteri f. nagariensis]|uniref:Peptidase M3A/M3B catalytic domain-containing protein n=1 Tax=Volvox carteri f. nagariensis TaxID=3068 RepID=D8TPV5_VOLCA|nr:uncharacterized protein VOLCADRAFT_88756 [Volvox carteri f. nagariensis]EFJ50295.1 hypothetical protein VOLCADRAFT_88756 [Volvox carteri f. nagariensis]|eukprot:XP_002948420.1 hypothetical protein VOLCADRAFT_88756 [Volvox carteri f. nagariensis]
MLLAEVLDTTPEDGVEVVALIDEMSDQLCRTYDAAECCRNVHSDPRWRQAAGKACVQLGEYISRVNHHEGMYQRLSTALAAYESSLAALEKRETPRLGPQQLAGWCSESVLVAQRLKQDMELGGIHLPSLEQRNRFAELAAANGHFGTAFNAALTDPSRVGRVRLGLGRSVSLEPSQVAALLVSEPHEAVRRQVYMAAGSSPPCNERLLEEMIAVRREMAQMQGYPSYAALRMAAGSIARTPAAVVTFLEQLAAEVRPMAERELQTLMHLKAFDMRNSRHPSASTGISAWDVEYYAARARQRIITSSSSAVLRYTAVPSVLAGVQHLLRRVFRMELRVSPAAPGEGWAPGVLRCDAEHADLGPLGTVYLDLADRCGGSGRSGQTHTTAKYTTRHRIDVVLTYIPDRPGKYPSAVTFPITCGRQLSPPSSSSSSSSRGDGNRQLPVMALLASASGTCPASGQPAMSYRELRVLLHELGHCCHNLLSRNKYQHLWGTRCAQDLVEVPSHLFEYFASDPRVMGLLARDRSGCAAGAGGDAEEGEPIPEELFRQLAAGRSVAAALELQQQLVLSLADQWLFGEGHGHAGVGAGGGGGGAGGAGGGLEGAGGGSYTGAAGSHIWRKAVHVASSVPYVPGTKPELRVGHLTIYGGAYYGYVYARCLAAQLWKLTGLEEAPLDSGPAAAGASPGAVAAAARLRRLEPWQVAKLRQRGVEKALAPAAEGGFLQALEGGFAPRPEQYLEMLRKGSGSPEGLRST